MCENKSQMHLYCFPQQSSLKANKTPYTEHYTVLNSIPLQTNIPSLWLESPLPVSSSKTKLKFYFCEIPPSILKHGTPYLIALLYRLVTIIYLTPIYNIGLFSVLASYSSELVDETTKTSSYSKGLDFQTLTFDKVIKMI